MVENIQRIIESREKSMGSLRRNIEALEVFRSGFNGYHLLPEHYLKVGGVSDATTYLRGVLDGANRELVCLRKLLVEARRHKKG